ncbi:response regulator [Novosphingobium terrae]|uniref:response regulator n=1 Tax=Novosphingobium terrae TaxID=2726189 RepID=UPI00198261A6|nr:response regulator transcription factor [Novosphingobium terrae]
MSAPSPARPISVLCVDDHPLLRDGIAAIIESQSDIVLVGEASNGHEAIALHRSLKPDITLMDLQMPELDGISAIEQICGENPKALIVVLTTYEGDVQAVRALKAGASSYLLKASLRHELLGTIHSVYEGKRFISPEVAQQIALHSMREQLSSREVSVLELVANGKANKDIAGRLSVSEETVKAHLRSIFLKLDVVDRTQAAAVAIRRGIIPLH